MTGARSTYASGRATRELLIQAAERLFAERGVEGVSLREVAVAAGQRNTAAVKYHFGDRDGLVGAVFEFRLPAINGRRLAMLDLLRLEDRLDDPRSLVEAYALPLVEEAAGGDNHYVGFLSRLSHHPQTSHPFRAVNPALTDSAEEVLRLLSALVPLPTRPLRVTRSRLVTGFVVNALANHQAALERRLPGTPPTGPFVDDVIAVATVMVDAPAITHDGTTPDHPRVGANGPSRLPVGSVEEGEDLL